MLLAEGRVDALSDAARYADDTRRAANPVLGSWLWVEAISPDHTAIAMWKDDGTLTPWLQPAELVGALA